MKYRNLLAATIVLASVSPASAGVVFQTSGVLEGGSAIFVAPGLAPGKYGFDLSFDAPVTSLNSSIAVQQRYQLFYNGTPAGGNSAEIPVAFMRTSASTFAAPVTLKAAYSVTENSIRKDYLDERLTSTSFSAVTNAQGPVHFTFTVTSAPEPASWAMMIGGFGLLGAASRRRRTVAFA